GERVGVVNAVHLGGLEQNVGIDLDGAQTGGGVGGEKRVAGAGAENHHAAFFQMPHRPAPDVILANRVDDRGKHAHVIRGNPIHAGARQARTAKNISASQHHRNLDPQLGQVANLAGDALEND